MNKTKKLKAFQKPSNILALNKEAKIVLPYFEDRAMKAFWLRTEKIRLLPHHPHFETWLNYCWLAKNLYNTTLYHCYEQYHQNKTIPSYKNLAHKFASENNHDFRALNNNSISQQIMKLVYQNFNSFFALIKKNKGKKKTNPDFIKVNPPNYYPKGELGVASFACPSQRILKQRFKQDNCIQLGGLPEEMVFSHEKFTTLAELESIQQIRVVPHSKKKTICEQTYIEIEIIYDLRQWLLANQKTISTIQHQSITNHKKLNKDGKVVKQTFYGDLTELKLCGIDVNLNQIACGFTQNENDISAVLYKTQIMKSVNHFYNKRKAQWQSELDNLKNQRKQLREWIKHENLNNSNNKELEEKVINIFNLHTSSGCKFDSKVLKALEEKLTLQIRKQANKIKRLKSFPLAEMIKSTP